MSVYDLRPTSRGTMRLKSSDAADHPELRFNYLSTDEDRRVAGGFDPRFAPHHEPAGAAALQAGRDPARARTRATTTMPR